MTRKNGIKKDKMNGIEVWTQKEFNSSHMWIHKVNDIETTKWRKRNLHEPGQKPEYYRTKEITITTRDGRKFTITIFED